MKFIALIAAISIMYVSGTTAQDELRPNVILILVDDLGISDLGYTGSQFYESPNIDRLSTESVDFRQAYASAAVCSPTRAAIMTGMNPARLKITNWLPGGPRTSPLPLREKLNVEAPAPNLPLETTTLAEVFQDAGYATGIVGKWHLGGEESLPEQHGFNLNIAGGHEGRPKSYHSPYKFTNLETKEKGEYLTDRLTDEAIGFIEEHSDRPFFLYLPFYTVHDPIQGKKEASDYFKGKRKTTALSRSKRGKPEGKKGKTRKLQNDAEYAAMIKTLDDNVGRLVQHLEDNSLDENTIIVFTSDNGGFSTYNQTIYTFFKPPTNNAPYRAGKAYPYEGGIRVPLLIKWKDRISPGVIEEQPVISSDLFPTLIELAGIGDHLKLNVDGRSFVPELTNDGSLSPRPFFWHFPHYHIHAVSPFSAVRSGDFKLIYWYETDRYEMYNVAEDVSEERNLVASDPGTATELKQLMERFITNMEAVIPVRKRQ